MEVQPLREAARVWSRRARELGSEDRGLVSVDAGVWAMTRPNGSVEIWSREPTAAERRAAVPHNTHATDSTARTPGSAQTSAMKRMVKLFGGAK